MHAGWNEYPNIICFLYVLLVVDATLQRKWSEQSVSKRVMAHHFEAFHLEVLSDSRVLGGLQA